MLKYNSGSTTKHYFNFFTVRANYVSQLCIIQYSPNFQHLDIHAGFISTYTCSYIYIYINFKTHTLHLTISFF